MNTNAEYKALYLREYRGIERRIRELEEQGNAEYQAAYRAEQKRRQPRKKPENRDKLDDETVDALQAAILPKYQEVFTLKELVAKANEQNRQRLGELADGVQPEPDPLNWYLIDYSTSGTYRSQGWGKHKYAEGALVPQRDALQRIGFVADIRRIVEQEIPASRFCGFYSPAETYYRFELWANCPPWMADACGRLSLVDFVRSCDDQQVSPRVYNPLIKPEMVDACRAV